MTVAEVGTFGGDGAQEHSRAMGLCKAKMPGHSSGWRSSAGKVRMVNWPARTRFFMKRLEAMKRWVWRYGPAVAVMALIFYASSHPKAALPNYGAYDWDVKKLAHLVSYAALAVAYLHAFAPGRRPSWRQAVAAVVLAGLYGATDEYHQSFVAGRGAGPIDVGIDTLGATLGALLAGLALPRWFPRLYSNSSSASSSSFQSVIDNN